MRLALVEFLVLPSLVWGTPTAGAAQGSNPKLFVPEAGVAVAIVKAFVADQFSIPPERFTGQARFGHQKLAVLALPHYPPVGPDGVGDYVTIEPLVVTVDPVDGAISGMDPAEFSRLPTTAPSRLTVVPQPVAAGKPGPTGAGNAKGQNRYRLIRSYLVAVGIAKAVAPVMWGSRAGGLTYTGWQAGSDWVVMISEKPGARGDDGTAPSLPYKMTIAARDGRITGRSIRT
jgi:hypothetical protein